VFDGGGGRSSGSESEVVFSGTGSNLGKGGRDDSSELSFSSVSGNGEGAEIGGGAKSMGAGGGRSSESSPNEGEGRGVLSILGSSLTSSGSLISATGGGSGISSLTSSTAVGSEENDGGETFSGFDGALPSNFPPNLLRLKKSKKKFHFHHLLLKSKNQKRLRKSPKLIALLFPHLHLVMIPRTFLHLLPWI
jgi:hypothetical protein